MHKIPKFCASKTATVNSVRSVLSDIKETKEKNLIILVIRIECDTVVCTAFSPLLLFRFHLHFFSVLRKNESKRFERGKNCEERKCTFKSNSRIVKKKLQSETAGKQIFLFFIFEVFVCAKVQIVESVFLKRNNSSDTEWAQFYLQCNNSNGRI